MRALLVKFSSLGDVVHALPALTDAHAQLGSDIAFDWVVEEEYAELAGWHPAVQRVIPVALRRWRKSLSMASLREARGYLASLRSCAYDAVVDAQGLIKTALVGALPARGPAHGFSAGCAREPLAALFYGGGRHRIDAGLHMVVRIRRLLAAALGYDQPSGEPDYGLAEHFAGCNQRAAVVLVHSSAQERKLIDEDKWITIAQRLEADGLQCELPWGSEPERLRAERIAAACGGEVLPRLEVGQLAELLAGAAGAVGLDTGLTHLAAAFDVPCVGLCVATDPARSGNLGRRQICLAHAGSVGPDEIARRLSELRSMPASA